MKVCIRRGAREIGGSCIEIESQGKRIVLDIGQPLICPDLESVALPEVSGFQNADDSLIGILISHPHLDHYGLANRLRKDTLFFMGAAAQRILRAASNFMPASWNPPKTTTEIRDLKSFSLGPFQITPYLVDHSAYDAYAFLVEADEKRLFYTGDLRAHGRKPKLFERLVNHPPKDADVLLMEGTTVQREETEHGFPSESEIENDMVRIFKSTPGMPLVWCSGQNIDRIVTIFRAAMRSGRRLIIDMYTAHILKATGNDRLPQAYWPQVRVFLPQFQKNRIKRRRQFALAQEYRPYRIFGKDLAAVKSNSVMLFRDSMRTDVKEAQCLDGARIVYSMWDGYLKEPKMTEFLEWTKQHELELIKCHTSGHASVLDLRRLRNAFASATAVPVHCAEPKQFAKTFDRVQVHPDNEWWEVK